MWGWARPSFPLGELETFALFELPAFLWGTFIKNESKLLKMLRVLTKHCLCMPGGGSKLSIACKI